MRLNELSPGKGAKKAGKRFGRGHSAGQGKTSGRGQKGQHARSGGYHKVGFEGGQMPLQRRLPKVGFRSRKAHLTAELRLHELAIPEAEVIDLDVLKKLNLVDYREGRRQDRRVVAALCEARKRNTGNIVAKKPQQNPADIAKAAGKLAELKTRILFLLGALIVFRVGTFIPVPGVDPVALKDFFDQQSGNLLGLFNLFSGGALSRFGLFALGIMPYISSSIIMQMASHIVPSLQQLRKEGEQGRRQIIKYTRWGTVALASFQSVAAASWLQNQAGLVVNPGPSFLITACITLVTGTMFLMWLGEQITERGIGNGISMIILAGIVAGMPAAIAGTAELVRNGEMSPATAILMFVGGVAAIVFVVFMERAQRRITVNYARRQQGRKMYAAQSTHLPFKINMSGVIPPIFASSILMFPATIAQFFGQSAEPNAVQRALQTIGANLGPGQPVYVLLYGAMIVFFCFFYTALMYNSKDTADNLKRAGAFLPGIRPGAHTADYIDRVLTRLTFWGSIYIAGVCLLPEFVRMFYPSMPFSFGGTSLLILVVVTMDFMSQLQAHAMSHQYDGMMQKANLRNYGRGGQLR
jgi:preprotein translocase subunit SecY